MGGRGSVFVISSQTAEAIFSDMFGLRCAAKYQCTVCWSGIVFLIKEKKRNLLRFITVQRSAPSSLSLSSCCCMPRQVVEFPHIFISSAHIKFKSRVWGAPERNPTDNTLSTGLPTELRCRNFCRRAPTEHAKSAPNVQKCVCNVYVFRPGLHFCMPPLLVG